MTGLALLLLLLGGDSILDRYKAQIGREQIISADDVTLGVKGTAFLKAKRRSDRFFAPVEWEPFDAAAEALRRLPTPEFDRNQIVFQCWLSPTGSFDRCHIKDSWPRGGEWINTAQMLMTTLKAEEGFARTLGEDEYVMIDLELRSPGSRRAEGCISAFCTIVPPPPPPPPAQPSGE